MCWQKESRLNFVLRNVEAAKGNVLTEATTKSLHRTRKGFGCHVCIHVCMATSSKSNKPGLHVERRKMVILAARDVYSFLQVKFIRSTSISPQKPAGPSTRAVDYDRELRSKICRVPHALPSAENRALGKATLCRVLYLVKNCTRQRVALSSAAACPALGKARHSAKALFAERNTRQRAHSAKCPSVARLPRPRRYHL